MQYVCQTSRAFRKPFGEHYRRIKKAKKIYTFLYQHFKHTAPVNVSVQPVEKIN